MPGEKLYQLALTLVPGVGHINIKNLISYLGSARQAFEAPKGRLAKIPGIGPATASAIKSFELRQAEVLLATIRKKNYGLLFYTDKDYPARLKNIYDAPALLYTLGEMDLNRPRMVAVVGTRQATTHGKAFVRELIKDLAAQEVTIVSGLAYGVDIEAHKAALQHGLPTIGVIASGLDILYPALHAKYARKMTANGGLVTEYPPGTKPDPARFPARNRIVAGLCQAVVVVESAEKGGAMITAALGRDYDREVFAVPGRWNDPRSAGCNRLIKDNTAQAITSAADLLYYMQWDSPATGQEPEQASPDYQPEAFSPEEWQVVEAFSCTGQEMHIDELSWRSQIPLSRLAGILLSLEFRGVVKTLPGKNYRLV